MCYEQIQRYNSLLETIKRSLVELEKGIKGLVVMSSDLEEVFECIHQANVPTLWGKAYPSQKPLGAWTRDLAVRLEQFSQWATTTHPPVLFWLSGFTFPTGFLTAVLQTAARKNNVRIQVVVFGERGCVWSVLRLVRTESGQLLEYDCQLSHTAKEGSEYKAKIQF